MAGSATRLISQDRDPIEMLCFSVVELKASSTVLSGSGKSELDYLPCEPIQNRNVRMAYKVAHVFSWRGLLEKVAGKETEVGDAAGCGRVTDVIGRRSIRTVP